MKLNENLHVIEKANVTPFISYEDAVITVADIIFCNFNIRIPKNHIHGAYQRIGKTTFVVTTSFSGTASETVENMLVRYVSDQILKH
jgi:hypothetical protein